MPLVKQHNTWAQAAGKGLNSVGNGPTSSSNSEMENDHQDNAGSSSTKVIRMEENVNESQIAAAYSEGWGQRGINQDTAWEVPSSPHLSPKEGSTWTSTSTGTEIWENNVRHHVKSSNNKAPTQMREPWGHTPSTHIGGTWGEEEDTTNLWTGVPQASGATWGGESNTSVWGANPAEGGKNWGSQNNAINPNMNPNWGSEPPALQIGLPHMPLANENKNIAALQIGLSQIASPPNKNKNIVEDSGPDNGPPWVDPSHKQNRTFSNWSPVTGSNKKMTPSGWEESAPQPPVTCQSGPNYDDGTAVWGNPVHQGKVSHWKDMPSAKQMPNCVMPPGNLCQGGNPCAPHGGPGMIRLPQTGSNMNKNDTVWMKNQSMNRNLNWNEVSSHRDPSGRRIWDDNPLPDKSVPGTPNTPNSAFGNWGEPGHPMGPYWGAKSKNPSCSWAEGQVDTSSWGGPMKQGGKPLSKDLIWASKQFRLLMEMNFKKDDIENALRRSNMNLEEALMELHAMNNKENSMLDIDGLTAMNLNQPRVHLGNVADEMNFTDHSIDNTLPPGSLYGNSSFPGMNMFSTGFNIAQNCKNQNSVGNSIAPNVLGNTGTNNQVPNFNINNSINNLSPAMMRKILQQTQTFNPACIPQNTGRMTQQNFPSTAQLRHLVQQIQMAVQAGHLNPTILNQPLAPQTLQLLYQLLQQIRFLHQLQQQQMYFTQHGSKPGSPPLQLSVQITQAKQHIVNLQNQIAAQQAIFLKQQVQLPVQHPSLQNPQPSTFDVVKSNLDTINGLHSEFRDLSVKDSTSQGHSRLTQWKLPSFEKDDNPTSNESNGCNRNNNEVSNEFSRAPGSITKSSSANSLASTTATHSASNLQPLSENTWPDMPRSQNDTWSDPNDSNNSVQGSNDNIGNSNDSNTDTNSNKHNSASENKDSPATSSNPSTSSSSQSYNLNDLVPEFEPGKPWKGTSRIKNFEDDPHVTPGSIAKSPLSLNSIKDSDLFTWNTKQNVPNLSTSSSLTSSTWTFSPPPSSQNSDSSSGRPANSRSWNNRPADQDRLSWKGPSSMPKTSRPPPGLSGQNKPITSNWIGSESGPQGWSANSGWEKQSGSNFLVLKNLTPQIDGSTLKTLCLQHGPLQLFHLLLNHGIALVRYSTREETEKARSALNNCVLSNTTILVDIPTEMEVKQYLQLASGQMGSNVSWPSGNGNGDSSFSSGSTFPISGSTNTASNGSSSSKLTTNNWNSASLNLQSSNLWSYSGSGNSLWAMQSSNNDHDQCIPSPLNSFLPGDLLGGGESI
ncbi:unnamed protein product [Larinioides sclopetarius]|uniref:RRM domain-containing protein n=1 Tax=Larinioides sclopetarius TaxID=280406 RepID=A0AAV2BEB6_9ARAC